MGVQHRSEITNNISGLNDTVASLQDVTARSDHLQVDRNFRTQAVQSSILLAFDYMDASTHTNR